MDHHELLGKEDTALVSIVEAEIRVANLGEGGCVLAEDDRPSAYAEDLSERRIAHEELAIGGDMEETLSHCVVA